MIACGIIHNGLQALVWFLSLKWLPPVNDKKVFLDEKAHALHSKAIYTDDLLCWVCYFFCLFKFSISNSWTKHFDQIKFHDVGANISMWLGQVLIAEELNQIWCDLSDISTLTWVPSIPSNLGNESHGKLKADQWRTLGITHLPLSLTWL